MKDDTISRAAAIALVEEVESKRLKGEIDLTYAPMIKGIKALPSAQPEIIRCKDCRYNNDCEIQYSAQSADEFFCGCAERKDNE